MKGIKGFMESLGTVIYQQDEISDTDIYNMIQDKPTDPEEAIAIVRAIHILRRTDGTALQALMEMDEDAQP